MTSFSARTSAEAVVRADQREIWDVLVDPVLMARFTPFLKKITADGDHWVWEMSGLDVAGLKVAPTFTELMVFSEPDRIEFRHDAPAGVKEKAGVQGWYDLSPADAADGPATRLATDLEITLDLPLPKAMGRVVRGAMTKVIEQMGDRFSANLLDHLGTSEV